MRKTKTFGIAVWLVLWAVIGVYNMDSATADPITDIHIVSAVGHEYGYVYPYFEVRASWKGDSGYGTLLVNGWDVDLARCNDGNTYRIVLRADLSAQTQYTFALFDSNDVMQDTKTWDIGVLSSLLDVTYTVNGVDEYTNEVHTGSSIIVETELENTGIVDVYKLDELDGYTYFYYDSDLDSDPDVFASQSCSGCIYNGNSFVSASSFSLGQLDGTGDGYTINWLYSDELNIEQDTISIQVKNDDLAQLNGDVHNLQIAATKAAMDIVTLQGSYYSLQTDIDDYNTMRMTSEKEFVKEFERIDAKINSTIMDIGNLSKDIDDAYMRWLSSNYDITDIRDDINSTVEKNQKIQNDINDLDRMISNFRNELTMTKNTGNETKATVDENQMNVEKEIKNVESTSNTSTNFAMMIGGAGILIGLIGLVIGFVCLSKIKNIRRLEKDDFSDGRFYPGVSESPQPLLPQTIPPMDQRGTVQPSSIPPQESNQQVMIPTPSSPPQYQLPGNTQQQPQQPQPTTQSHQLPQPQIPQQQYQGPQ